LNRKNQKMKIVLTYIVAILFFQPLAHSASWEGSDDFSSGTAAESRWGTYNQKIPHLYSYVAGGRLRVIHDSNVHAAYRVWGKKWHKLPTAACWTIQADVFLPATPTSTRTEFTKAGLGVTPNPNSKHDLWLGVKQEFWNGFAIGFPNLMVDDVFRTRPSPESEEIPLGQDLRSFRLTIAHDALQMKDTLTIRRLDNLEILEERQVVSALPVAKTILAYVGISGKPSWSALGTDLGVDNWSVVEDNPAPINLTAQTSTARGVAYSVAATGLDLINQKLTGTVALTVGTASATMPITGSIDKSGYFALTAKGTGSNKGFGCMLLYDVATGTYRPNKNTVTAPKQKAIKF
jgi:hypothetical protein